MSEDIKKEILKTVDKNREEIISFVRELIRIPSVSGDEGKIQSAIAEKLERLDLQMDVSEIDLEKLSQHPGFVPLEEYRKSYKGRPNVVGTLKGSGGGRSLILMGHVDTVAVQDRTLWKHDPFGAEIEDGKIYGRGAVDMKGGVAAQIMAVKCLLDSGVSPKGDVIVENVIEEEAGGNGAIACAQRGYRADAGIYTEPSGFDFIGVSNRGAQFFRITVTGMASMIEGKWGMPNAIEKAIYIYKAVDDFSLLRQSEVRNLPVYDKLYKLDSKMLKKIPAPMTRIYTDNIVPTGICQINAYTPGPMASTFQKTCVMEGSLECLPSEDIQQIKKRFKDYVLRVAESDPWLRENPPKIEWFGLWFEASQTDSNHPIVKTVQNNCQHVVGKMPIPRGGGGSDLRCLVKYAHTPSVVFGGGTGGNAHGVDEYLNVDSLINSTKVLALSIIDWCGS